MPALDDYSGSTMGNLPIGQGLAVTPMQMVAGYAAIANGGILQPPQLIKQIGEEPVHEPKGQRVIEPEVAAEVRDMLEGVLAPGGTASEVSVPGYTLAGKTGTAQVAEDGGYSETNYVASFIGFAPAQDPKLLAAVIVDEPQGDSRRLGRGARRSARSPRSRCPISAYPPNRAGAPDALPRIGRMRLDELLAGAAGARGSSAMPAVEIDALAYDSRKAGPGTLFFCVPGEKVDGHEFAAAGGRGGGGGAGRRARAGARGAAGRGRRRAGGDGAAGGALLGRPDRASCEVVGVTGTNGKTTTAFLVREILEAAGRRTAGLLGTVKQVVGGVEEEVERTTPEAIDLQATFRRMLDGRRRGLRDGGLLARDGPAPRRRDRTSTSRSSPT